VKLCTRSADNRTCLVKRSRNQLGDRCFATAGPTLRNSLPKQLQQPDITFGQLNDHWRHLCLVSWATAPCVWTLKALTRNLLTYLLTWAAVVFFPFYHVVCAYFYGDLVNFTTNLCNIICVVLITNKFYL